MVEQPPFLSSKGNAERAALYRNLTRLAKCPRAPMNATAGQRWLMSVTFLKVAAKF